MMKNQRQYDDAHLSKAQSLETIASELKRLNGILTLVIGLEAGHKQKMGVLTDDDLAKLSDVFKDLDML